MRALVKSLGFVFLAILFGQLLTLPSYTTVRQRDADVWPEVKGIISSTVAVRTHRDGVVRGFIVSPSGREVAPFTAPDTALKGPAAAELKQFDRMAQRRRVLAWSLPLNLLLIILGFLYTDFWEKRHPVPPRAFAPPETTPEQDAHASQASLVEHARMKREAKERMREKEEHET